LTLFVSKRRVRRFLKWQDFGWSAVHLDES